MVVVLVHTKLELKYQIYPKLELKYQFDPFSHIPYTIYHIYRYSIGICTLSAILASIRTQLSLYNRIVRWWKLREICCII